MSSSVILAASEWGDTLAIPYTNFKTRILGEWQDLDTEKIFNDKIEDVFEPSTAPITIGGPITCHGYKKSYGYKKNGYQGKHSLSVSVAYDILHIETCVESSGSPLKTNVSLE